MIVSEKSDNYLAKAEKMLKKVRDVCGEGQSPDFVQVRSVLFLVRAALRQEIKMSAGELQEGLNSNE